MSQILTYRFDNRYLQLCHLHEKKSEYSENLGRFFNSIHVLDKEHPDFQQDIALLSKHSEIILLKNEPDRLKALFIINAEQIKAISPDTLSRLHSGICSLPKEKKFPKISLVA